MAKLGIDMITFDEINNPVSFARRVLRFEPKADQEQLLAATNRYVILNCHRQWGKTTVTAVGSASGGDIPEPELEPALQEQGQP